MSAEISIPFRLNSSNRIAVETNPNKQIRQHVMSLVNTEPGERVIHANYGVPFSNLLFEDDDPSLVNDLVDMMSASFKSWEPGLKLSSVTPVSGSHEDGISEFQVAYVRADAPEAQVTAPQANYVRIGAGGQVKEVIRG